ncbi:MAG: precorrin-6A reductase [Desulfonatronovibrio sp.]
MKTGKILILGGISESIRLAAILSEKGFPVLVSRATDVPLDEPSLPGALFRRGRLDQAGLKALVRKEHVSVIIDCTHPFAREISSNAFDAAQSLGLPFLVYDRPGLDPETPGVLWAGDHPHAAELALREDKNIFLSIGSNNISLYTDRAGEKRKLLFARVLPGPEFLEGCLKAGLKQEQVIQARGPFSTGQNIHHLQSVQAGVLITKDSGEQGGVPSKLAAAAKLDVKTIMVKRPPRPGQLKYDRIEDLVLCLERSWY